MKKTILTVIILLCSFAFIPFTVIAGDQSSIIYNDRTGIPDKGLYRAILRELGKKENKMFTEAEAAAITELNANNYNKKNINIKSLKGIEKLTDLESLDLNYNQITSLDGVEKLVKLKSLGVYDNKLTKLPNLKKLTNLNSSHTYFHFNKIKIKEFKKKLPKNLLNSSRWFKSQTKFQSVKKTVKLASPASLKKVTKNTSKITGRTQKKATVVLKTNAGERIKKTKADGKGRFVLKNLNLDKYEGKKLILSVSLYNSFYDEYWELKSVKFTIQKTK